MLTSVPLDFCMNPGTMLPFAAAVAAAAAARRALLEIVVSRLLVPGTSIEEFVDAIAGIPSSTAGGVVVIMSTPKFFED